MTLRSFGKAVSLLLAGVLLAVPYTYISGVGYSLHEKPALHQCGCPKDKVASRACCCFKMGKRGCCDGHGPGNAHSDTTDDRTLNAPIFRCAGCAPQEGLTTDPAGDTKSAAGSGLQLFFSASSLLTQTTDRKPGTVFLKVPVPPPEKIYLSPIMI